MMASKSLPRMSIAHVKMYIRPSKMITRRYRRKSVTKNTMARAAREEYVDTGNATWINC